MPLEFEIKPNGATLTNTGSTNYYVPYSTYYHDNRLQFILLASELQAAGLTPGDRIVAIKFRCGSSIPGRNLVNFRIRMQNTNMTTSTSWVTSGWTLVFGPTTIPQSLITAHSWQQHDFATPFVWDGRNLLIDTSRDDTGWTAGGGNYVYSGYTLANRACGKYHDSITEWPYDTLTPVTVGIVPQTILVVEARVPVNITSTPASADAILCQPQIAHNSYVISSPAFDSQASIIAPDVFPKSEIKRPPAAQQELSFVEPIPRGDAIVLTNTVIVAADAKEPSVSVTVGASCAIVAASVGYASVSITGQVGEKVLSIENDLIQTRAAAKDMAARALAVVKDPFATFTLSVRGNPALELMDVVRIGSPSDYIAPTDVVLVRIRTIFDGALSAEVEARKAVR